MVKKLKDKKISILKKQYIEDEIGNQYEDWADLTPTPIWAYFRQLSGTERASAAVSDIVTEEVLFRINWRDDIDTSAVVKFRGTYYEITRIDTFEGYKEDLSLYCKLPPRQDIYTK